MRPLGILGGLLFSAALAITPARADGPLPVVATTSVLGDMVAAIGGGAVTVASLVGPDADAHTYEPRPKDAQALAAAKLLVMNGLGLEGWLDRLRGSVQYAGSVVIATKGVKPLAMDEEEAGKTAKPKRVSNPHAWQSPANGQIYVANIVEGLAAADPAHAAEYRKRGDAYRAELAALDAKIRAQLAAIPKEKRRVITTHDAFQYYGKEYGVEFLAPLGISTDAEPSAGELARLERQIKKEHIKALFLENVTNPRLIEQIAKETGGIVGPPLYSDALSKPGKPADTYLKMLEYNTATLVAGMQQN